MISIIESVNYVISLLKQYGIKNAVLAPGASDIPLIHVLETDKFFNCYSVVDERSLVYFAIGISQELNEPVVCVCTSGTAVSNFLPGMTEAFYQNVPIIAITSDKNQNYQGQIETQKIQQVGIFGENCKKCVNLPVIKDDEDRWLCIRLINEALIEMTHHGKGPVQINIPIIGDIGKYKDVEIKKCKKIEFIENIYSEQAKHLINTLKFYNKIMIIVGQDIYVNKRLLQLLEKFFERNNAIIAIDHQSNVNCLGAINTYPVTETEKQIDDTLIPDLVISIGNNISSYDLKYILRNAKNLEHWQIDESGRIRDVFHHLTSIFECTPDLFFELAVQTKKSNSHSYFDAWKNEKNRIVIEDIPYSSFFVAQKLSKVIPSNSILHLAILNSTRLMQYFDLNENVTTYSNFGALGIDGCLSTFMGQAVATDELAFCLIGDLSFFYDMNAAGIIHRKNNIRIILLNNTGAGEFYFTLGKEKISTIDTHIAARNIRKAQGWVESLGYKYYEVHSVQDVNNVFPKLAEKSKAPVFVEVFLDIEDDTKTTKDYYQKYINIRKSMTKNIAKNILSDKQYDTLKSAYHMIRKKDY